MFVGDDAVRAHDDPRARRRQRCQETPSVAETPTPTPAAKMRRPRPSRRSPRIGDALPDAPSAPGCGALRRDHAAHDAHGEDEAGADGVDSVSTRRVRRQTTPSMTPAAKTKRSRPTRLFVDTMLRWATPPALPRGGARRPNGEHDVGGVGEAFAARVALDEIDAALPDAASASTRPRRRRVGEAARTRRAMRVRRSVKTMLHGSDDASASTRRRSPSRRRPRRPRRRRSIRGGCGGTTKTMPAGPTPTPGIVAGTTVP